MKTLLTLLVLAAGIAFGVSKFLEKANRFGTDPSEPLGKYEIIDRYLAGQRMTKLELDPDELGDLFGQRTVSRSGLSALLWEDPAAGDGHFVAMLRNEKGDVVAIGGEATDTLQQFSKGGSRTQTFLSLLWLEVLRDEPEFLTEGDELVAYAERGRAECVWLKAPSEDRTGKMNDQVTLYARRAMLRGKANRSSTGN